MSEPITQDPILTEYIDAVTVAATDSGHPYQWLKAWAAAVGSSDKARVAQATNIVLWAIQNRLTPRDAISSRAIEIANAWTRHLMLLEVASEQRIEALKSIFKSHDTATGSGGQD